LTVPPPRTTIRFVGFLPRDTSCRTRRHDAWLFRSVPIPITQSIQLGLVDWFILILYFAFVVGIGAALKRGMKSSNDFFMSGRNIPSWIAGLAFLSANLGAQEVM
jgi:hypothetical protein